MTRQYSLHNSSDYAKENETKHILVRRGFYERRRTESKQWKEHWTGWKKLGRKRLYLWWLYKHFMGINTLKLHKNRRYYDWNRVNRSEKLEGNAFVSLIMWEKTFSKFWENGLINDHLLNEYNSMINKLGNCLTNTLHRILSNILPPWQSHGPQQKQQEQGRAMLLQNRQKHLNIHRKYWTF